MSCFTFNLHPSISPHTKHFHPPPATPPHTHPPSIPGEGTAPPWARQSRPPPWGAHVPSGLGYFCRALHLLFLRAGQGRGEGRPSLLHPQVPLKIGLCLAPPLPAPPGRICPCLSPGPPTRQPRAAGPEDAAGTCTSRSRSPCPRAPCWSGWSRGTAPGPEASAGHGLLLSVQEA